MLLNVLGHRLLAWVVGKPASEQFVVASGLEQRRILLENPLEVAAGCLARFRGLLSVRAFRWRGLVG